MKWRFELDTARIVKVLNTLRARGIKADKVTSKGRALGFVIDGRDKEATQAVLEELAVPYHRETCDLAGLCYRGIKRPLLPLLAVLLLGVAVALCHLVWEVEVVGMEEPVLSAAEEIAADCKGKWCASIDRESLASRLVALDGVAQVSIRMVGVKMRIELLSELPKGELAPDDYAPIVARCDCVVTSVVVERGRAMVKVGDTVRAGDVLIAPEYLVDKEADVTVPCQAKGEVLGTVYYSRSVDWRASYTVEEETGESYRSAVISVADHPMGRIAPSPYPRYREEAEVIRLGIALPVTVERRTYYQLVERTIEGDWEAEKGELQEAIMASLDDMIKKGVHLQRKWCIIEETDFGYKLIAYAQVEEEVSSRSPQGEQ